MAARQLLELSATRNLNTTGHTGTREEGVKLESPGVKLDLPHTLNGFVRPHPHPLKNNKTGLGLVNGDSTGVMCQVEEEEEEEEDCKEVLPGVSKVKGIHLPVGSSSLSPSPPPSSLEEEGKEEIEDYMDTAGQEGI